MSIPPAPPGFDPELPEATGAAWTPAVGQIVFFPYPTKTLTINETYELMRRVNEEETDPVGLIAAAEVHTGAMIAFIPNLEDVVELAQPGGEPLEQLHITSLFLGDAIDWDDDDRESIHVAIADLAQRQPVIQAEIFGFAIWNPDAEVCLVASISGEDVADAQASVEAEVDELELDYPDQHYPWVPHMTLAYGPTQIPPDVLEKVGPITIDRIRVAFGGVITDYPLGGGLQGASTPHVFHLPGKHSQAAHGKGGGATIAPASEVAANKKVFDSGGQTGPEVYDSIRFGQNRPSIHDADAGAIGEDVDGVPAGYISSAAGTYMGNGSNPEYPGILREAGGDLEGYDGPTKGFKNKQQMIENTRLMDHGMENSKLTEPAMVHRGIADPQGQFGDAWNDTDVTGLTWTEHSYVSTSSDKGVARYHSDRSAAAKTKRSKSGALESRPQEVIMTIRAPKGSGSLSGAYREQEVLLPRGRTFQVVTDHGFDSDGLRQLDVVMLG